MEMARFYCYKTPIRCRRRQYPIDNNKEPLYSPPPSSSTPRCTANIATSNQQLTRRHHHHQHHHQSNRKLSMNLNRTPISFIHSITGERMYGRRNKQTPLLI